MRPMRQEQFDHAVAHATLQNKARRTGGRRRWRSSAPRHSRSRTSALIGTGIDAHDEVAAQSDPAALSDRALARRFHRTVAEREMQAALAAAMPISPRAFSSWRATAMSPSIPHWPTG